MSHYATKSEFCERLHREMGVWRTPIHAVWSTVDFVGAAYAFFD